MKRMVFHLTHPGQILARRTKVLMSAERPEWFGGIIGIGQAERRIPVAPDKTIRS
jgi:hypothetical protein